MSFFVHHRFGGCERDPPLSSLPALLDELEDRLEDEEHVTVSLVHESEWALGIQRGGYVFFENVERDDEPRHMAGLARQKILELLASLSRGDLARLEKEPWEHGY